MVSLIKKIKSMYKSSYFYANKRYGKYTKRRPFPNYNAFDCSPSGDFSVSEIPSEMNHVNNIKKEKSNFEKSKSYIINDVNIVTEGNNVYMTTVPVPVYTENIDTRNYNGSCSAQHSKSVSPITTISDSNTEFTMVNTNSPQSQNMDNTFFDVTEASIFDNSDSFITNIDGVNFDNSAVSNNGNGNYYTNQMKRISHNNSNRENPSDRIKVKYNGKNNWKAETRRYYPSIPQTTEPSDYYGDNSISTIDMKKKNRWWKKIVPKSSKRDSFVSDSTFYDNKDFNTDYNSKGYISARDITYCNDEYSSKNYNYGESKYNYQNYSRYDTVNLDDVLVYNNNASKMINTNVY